MVRRIDDDFNSKGNRFDFVVVKEDVSRSPVQIDTRHGSRLAWIKGSMFDGFHDQVQSSVRKITSEVPSILLNVSNSVALNSLAIVDGRRPPACKGVVTAASICVTDCIARRPTAAAVEPQRVRRIERIVPRVRIRLTRLRHIGIDTEELGGRRVVVAVSGNVSDMTIILVILQIWGCHPSKRARRPVLGSPAVAIGVSHFLASRRLGL